MTAISGTSELMPAFFIDPGKHLDNDPRLMRDYACASYDKNQGMLSVTVGDMANNHTGTDYLDKETADYRGLESTMRFNGGLIGSVALQRHLRGVTTSGAEFVSAANGIIHAAHERLGVDSANGAERLTGYLTHAVVTPDLTTITTVGDVNTWVNGAPLFDTDHPLGEIIGTFLTNLAEKPDECEQLVSNFADHVELDNETARVLLSRLKQRQAHITDTFTRQDAYLATSVVLTPWYMNYLQNTTNHPYSYGAIDGTATPDKFIREATIPTADIASLIIATDGSKPHSPGASVFSLDDLTASNPVYCERTAVDLSHPARLMANLACRSQKIDIL